MDSERQQTYEELVELVAELRAEIAELKARLGENSSNSSRPPSSDGYAKPTRQQRRATERKAGKQKGATGSHLAQVADPENVVVHTPTHCVDCNGDLCGAPVVDVEARQVFDIPPMSIVVTEHRAESRQCACGTTSTALFPEDVDAPALYGNRLRALATYLIVFQHIPYDRTRQLFCDVLGVDLSAGTILGAVREGAAGLDSFRDAVREQLRSASVVNFDETGARVAGRLHWVHTASTGGLTDYFVHAKRGGPAMNDGGVLGHLDGVAVHDGWKPYRNYDVTHGLCNAHHLRELSAAGVVWNQTWAIKMIELLVDTKAKTEQAIESGLSSLDDSTLHGIRCRYARLIAEGRSVNQRQQRRKQTKTFNLIERLDDHRDDVLRFASDFRVPFDNNQAERDIRMVKLQQKISGCWRTINGASAYLSIRSYISTARKHGENPLEVLRQLFDGHPWLPLAQPT